MSALTAPLTILFVSLVLMLILWFFVYALPELDHFKGSIVSQWMADHLEIPILASGFYLFLVLKVSPMSLSSSSSSSTTFLLPFHVIKSLNIAWNLLLTVFSFVGAYYCLPRLLNMLFSSSYTVEDVNDANKRITRSGSLYNAVCDWYPTQFYTGRVGAFVALFILSKIPEMIDTVFLILKKKPLIFLHWYHHITVMLYCWHAYVYHISGGLFFATMNYCVHSVMYCYYFLAECGYGKLLRPVAPFITFLQIAQMVLGGFVEVYSLYYIYGTAKGCPGANACNSRLGFLMYASYFFLFSKLFKDKYLSTGDKHKKMKKLDGDKTTTTTTAAVNHNEEKKK